jgi:inner membrane protein
MEGTGGHVRTSVIQKLAVMAGLFIVMLFPIAMIYSLIWERTARRDEAAREISSQWGGPQVVTGPILTVPFEHVVERSEGRREIVRDHASYLPLALTVDASLTPEIRKRGLFGVPVYRAALKLRGRFRRPDLREIFTSGGEMRWSEARLSLVLSDPRGIAGPVQMAFNGARQDVVPGLADTSMGSAGISTTAPGLTDTGPAELPFEIVFELNGTRALEFLPTGNETTVAVQSAWAHPGFTGAPLPYSHTIDANGFRADWRVPFFGRGFPASWRVNTLNRERFAEAFRSSAFGVTLVQPVDIYQQTTRAVKYAALFIVLTFVIAFLWEIIGGVLVHPIQYVFIGFALCLFYLLLLAFSEHLAFDRAYLAAAGPTVVLISWYWRWVINARGRAIVMLGALTTLYGYLYLLLQLEDYALLAGALGLFMMLGAVMFLTRRVDWFGLKIGTDKPEVRPT